MDFKQCKQCDQTKLIIDFSKYDICKLCYDTMLRKCISCDINKNLCEFEFRRQQCKECRKIQRCKKEKPIVLVVKKICNKCHVEKDESEYKLNTVICKDCYCEQARIEREKLIVCSVCHCSGCEMHSTRVSVCKTCYDIIDRECLTCKVSKNPCEFRIGNNICIDCCKIKSDKRCQNKKENITTKKCTNCDIIQDNVNFKKMSDICNNCFNILPRKCNKCNEIKNVSEYRTNVSTCTCLDCERKGWREYRRLNPSTWAITNSDRMKALQRDYYEKNKRKIREQNSNRYHNEPKFNYYKKQKSKWIRNLFKDTLYVHWFQYNFTPNMNVNNYTIIWNVDHIVPCSYFYTTEEDVKEEFKIIFDWRNTRPSEIEFNSAKKSKLSYNCYQNQKEKVLQFCKEQALYLLEESIKYFDQMDALLKKFNKEFIYEITSLVNEIPSTEDVKSVLSSSD